jgi:glyoxylase-like metal-dependent hydrolase (beta-lactamase superfamily II)
VTDFRGDRPQLDLDVRWVHGTPPDGASETGPPLQAHALDEHTWLLRQNKTTHFEGPFLALLFGADRALLLDTGATADADVVPLRATVDRLVGDWLERHPRERYPLVVAHTHAHGDHVAGDGQFADRPDTVVVGHGVDDVRAFFGFAQWPAQVVPFDLGGGRVLELTGIPGHHASSVAVLDPWTRVLFTGDTVYPGRIYVEDSPAFVDSLERLVALAAERGVQHVIGCHIELAADGREFPFRTRYQPGEPPIHQPVDVLTRMLDVARSLDGRRALHRGEGFVVVDLPAVGELRWRLHGWRLRVAHARRMRVSNR